MACIVGEGMEARFCCVAAAAANGDERRFPRSGGSDGTFHAKTGGRRTEETEFSAVSCLEGLVAAVALLLNECHKRILHYRGCLVELRTREYM